MNSVALLEVDILNISIRRYHKDQESILIRGQDLLSRYGLNSYF